jgi:hypothetical protein
VSASRIKFIYSNFTQKAYVDAFRLPRHIQAACEDHRSLHHCLLLYHGDEHLVEVGLGAAFKALKQIERSRKGLIFVLVEVVLEQRLGDQHCKYKDDDSAASQVSQLLAYL